MGLFTRKKRDPPPSSPSTLSPTSHPSSPSHNLLSIPSDQRSTTSDHSQKSRVQKPTSSSSSRFTNIFRSTSRPEPVPVFLAPPVPPNPPRHSLSDQSNGYYGGNNAGIGAGAARNDQGSQGSWDGLGVPSTGRNGSNAYGVEPLDRYRLFAGGRASSTPSLPVFHPDETEAKSRISSSTARETINETIYPIELLQNDEEQMETGAGGGKWNRWKMGRGPPKPRTGSMSSMRMFGGGEATSGSGSKDGDDGGFVVKSFRTVSRVHEDPVAAQSAASPPLPALPSLPSGSALSVYDQQDSQQQESIRASIDLGSSQPRRPPLTVLPANSSSTSGSSSRFNFGDRAPSPSTISVEAFRLASARSKSSASLTSLGNVDSPPLDNDRPKFEPAQRPSSRASRRQSNYSDLSVDTGSAFLPPRPRFANHSNSSSSSLQSRKSSNHSLGSQTPPIAQSFQPSPSEANAIVPSDSIMSMNSFTTAAEPRTAPTSARTTPAASRVASPVKKSPPTSSFSLPASSTQNESTLPVRPANVKRLSSGDSELRWIASYADSITSSEVTTSPVTYKSPPLPFPAPRSPPKMSPTSTPKSKTMPNRASHTPSFSVQPPTPATVSDSSPSSSPLNSRAPPSNRQYPQRSSSLITDSTKAALQSMGIGESPRRQSVNSVSKPSPTSIKTRSKASRAASRGWMSDSSDEDQQEALETDTSNSDSDDEVPLSQIRSRSQTDLSLPPALLQAEQRAKAELEAASVSKQAVQAAESKLTGGVKGSSTLGLVRRGSNRRSVSTLSLATSAMVIPTPSAASSSTPNFAPSSPTRSILQRPHHPRSVSNPNSPYPTSASVSAPPPVPAIPAGVADRSSSSSGTGSSSSALLTPGDLSPAVSDLGLKSHAGIPHLSKPSVKFDLAALSGQSDPARWNKGRRASAIHQSSQSNIGSQFSLHRPTQSLQPSSFALQNAPRATASLAPSRGPRSSLVPSPSANSLASSRTAVEAAAANGSVYDRMKARHKQEAVEAIKLGADLNHPSGIIPDNRDAEDEDEDEDEPLANLPTRGAGSMMGGMEGGSMLGGMPASPYGQGAMGMGMNMGVGFGGAYSPLALAPFGVDPYLYASLPLDQKMSLHQRSQQMMAMMQQAAIQAQAESVVGSTMGGAYGSREGSMLGGESTMRGAGGGDAGPRGRLHGASMSMSNLDSFGSYGGSPRGGGQPQFNAGARLPPFAPTFAMSAPFMHPGVAGHQHSGSLYQSPTHANSAIGFSPVRGGGSTIGGPTNNKGLNPGGRAASMMGFDQRR